MPVLDRPQPNRPPSLKRVLALVRRSARSNERASARLSEFNRLYLFYSQLEEDRLQVVPTRDERQRENAFNARTDAEPSFADELAQRIAQQQAVQAKYLDYPGYYALLTSFYTAFIAPLEQDIAIAETCEELQLTTLEVGPGRQPVSILVAAFERQAAQVALVEITGLFDALGTALSPVFIITDFMRDVRRQAQDDNY